MNRRLGIFLILILGSASAHADILVRENGSLLTQGIQADESLSKLCQGISDELHRADQLAILKTQCLGSAAASAPAQAVRLSEDGLILAAGFKNALYLRRGAKANVIAGEATLLKDIQAVALDGIHNEVYALQDDPTARILAFAADHDGNVSPHRILDSMALRGAVSLAVDPVNDELWVVNPASNQVLVLRRRAQTGTGQARFSQEPLRVLGGEGASWTSLSGVAVSADRDEVYVLDSQAGRILVFARTASGTAAPLRTIGGESSGIDQPIAIGYSPRAGEIQVRNGDGRIFAFPADAAGDVSPIQIFR
jgi:DNA-binding beta-propeller fold protein YncE